MTVNSRSRLKRVALLFAAVAASLILLEGLCSALAWFQRGTLDVAQLHEREANNTWILDSPAGYAATLMPDPYLGNRNNAKILAVNNVGLLGRDFPFEKDPDTFTVLLTGGSVAAQLGLSGELERRLNRGTFDRPVTVLNAAGGGWKQPQQAIALMLYGELADAVITLDGYNERFSFVGNRNRLEAQIGNFAEINPIIDGGFDRLGAAWETARLRRFAVASHSRAVYYMTAALRHRIEASVEPPPAEGPTPSSVYTLPADWKEDRCIAFNLGLYRKYIGLMDAMAKELGLLTVHFIQPCPAIGKTLTSEERQVVGILDYAPTYQWLADQLLELNGEDVAVVSLLDVFDDVDGTIYADQIHCRKDGVGYRILAQRMADELERRWSPAN